MRRIDPTGRMLIKQEGIFYSVASNDALILNKYLGYKLYGFKKLKTGFHIKSLDVVLKKIDKLGMDYDVVDQNENIILVKRFPVNGYEVVDPTEYHYDGIETEIPAPQKQIKLKLKDRMKLYIDVLQGFSEGCNLFTGEVIKDIDDNLKSICFEMSMFFDERYF